MSDLLTIGASAIGTLRAALATVGENVANAETPGYVRRTVRVSELAPSGTTAGARYSGVRLVGIERQWNERQAAESRALGGEAAVARAKADSAAALELALADNEAGIGKNLTALFAAGDRWAADPGSAVARRGWLGQLDATVDAFNRTGDALDRLRSGNNAQLESAVAGANELLGELAAINRSIRTVSGNSAAAAALHDRRDLALDRLSALTDVRVSFNERGEVKVSSAAMVLVDGIDSASLSVDSSSPNPTQLLVQSNRGSATLQPASGRIAGMIAGLRSLDQNITELDTLAGDFIGAINSWSQSGFAPDGGPGGALLSGDSGDTIALLPTNPDRLAAASMDAANGNLLSLRHVRLSGQFEQRWDQLIAGTGNAKAMADRATTASTALHTMALARQALRSGVDLDREAADLLRLQQAYGAAARILDAAKSAVETILAIR